MGLRYLTPLFLLATALGQSPAEPKAATIEGTVVNSVTGMPLRKADLSLANGEMPAEMAAMMKQFGGDTAGMPKVATKTLTAVTDAAGKFRFENVAPGTYWLTAKKSGFGDKSYAANGSSNAEHGSLRLTSGQELKGVELHMVPHGSVAGRVVDEDGEPLSTVTVSALSDTFVQGRRRLVPVDAAQTNHRGEFSLGKLPPGRYVICADVLRMAFSGNPVPQAPADGTPETGYVSTYLPNTIDATQAQKVVIAPAAEVTGLSIQMQKSRVVRVRGRLTDEAGQPIKSAQIMLMAAGRPGSITMASVNDADGKFEIANVQPGSYSLTTMQLSGSSPKISMQPLVVTDKNIEDLKPGARAEGTIQGKVSVDGEAKFSVNEFEVTLTAAEGLVVMPSSAAADGTGAFTLAHITPAVFELSFPNVPAGAYIKSAEFNGRDVLGLEIDCSGLTAGALHVVLGADGGTVEGRVAREDKPAADATVVLVPADPARRFPENVRQGSSDEAGHITLKDIPPGDYLAFAWEKVEEGIWFDPEFLKNAQSKAVKLQIRPKAKETVELKLISAADSRE